MNKTITERNIRNAQTNAQAEKGLQRTAELVLSLGLTNVSGRYRYTGTLAAIAAIKCARL